MKEAAARNKAAIMAEVSPEGKGAAGGRGGQEAGWEGEARSDGGSVAN